MSLKRIRNPLAFCFTVVLLTVFLCIPAAAIPSSISAAETSGTESGWIEARATVPDGFHSIVILSVENQETLEVYDIECLPDNNFVGSAKVPAGSYLVSMAFVYQNYTYTVTPSPTEFDVDANADSAAASIALTVISPETPTFTEEAVEEEVESFFEKELAEELQDEEITIMESEDASEPFETEEDVQFEDPSEAEEELTLRGLLMEMVYTLMGALLLACVVFGVCWLYRRYQENNS